MHPNAIRFCAGFYGPHTTEAVAKLQQSSQLEPTGQYDDAARDALSLQLSNGSAKEAKAPAGESEVDTLPTPPSTSEQQQEQAETGSNKQLLLDMGFTEEAVDGVLAGTNGSVEHAAALLLGPSPSPAPAAPEFPAEWEGLLDDLKEMGFKHELAKATLLQTDGNVKDAVKAMVAAERDKAL